MNSLKSFLKSTVIGGLMFLVPVVLVLIVLAKALQLTGKVAQPLAAALPFSQIGGIGVATLLAIVILVAIAFAAGVLARTSVGERITHWFEESILGGLPQYRMVKSLSEGLLQVESGGDMRPVLMQGDDGWMLGYQVETLPNGWVVVFLPSSPTPMQGSVVYVEPERVRQLDLTMVDAMQLVKRLGIGSAEKLGGIRLEAGSGG